MMKILLLTAVLGACFIHSQQQDMPSGGLSQDGLSRLGSKTNYRTVFANNFPSGFPSKRPAAPWSKICKPIHLYSFSRHGHRYLGDSDMENARDFAAQFRGKYRNTLGAKWLAKYKLPWKINDDKLLTPVGKEDMEKYGKRVVQFWPDLSFDPSNTNFFTSSPNRTYDSAKAFIDGFSSALKKGPKDFKLVVDNFKTRFYDYCEKYKVQVDDNDTALIEAHKFLKGPEMAVVLKNVKRRLGLEAFKDTMIDKDREVMKDLYYMCQAELAEKIKKPIWCYIFDDKDAVTMEYFLDTETYYEESYGYKINQEMACPLVKDVFTKMDAAVDGVKNNKNYDRGVFGFGHSGSLIPLFTAFGLFKPDKPLTSTNFLQQTNRKFRVSQRGPFSGNLEFVLHDCMTSSATLTPQEKAGLPSKMERFMVLLYSNEKLAKFPACPDNALCPYSTIRASMDSYMSCSLNKVCAVHVVAGGDGLGSYSLFMTVALLVAGSFGRFGI